MQNPPPEQQNYGTPGGSPPPTSSSPLGGMDPKISAAISYIWIVGVVFFILEKENKFVRFHAFQSIFLSVACIALMIVEGIINSVVFAISWRLFGLIAIVWTLLGLGILALAVNVLAD